MYKAHALHGKAKRPGYNISHSGQPQDREPEVNVSLAGLLFIASSVGGSDRTDPMPRVPSLYTLESGCGPGSGTSNQSVKQLGFARAKPGNLRV